MSSDTDKMASFMKHSSFIEDMYKKTKDPIFRRVKTLFENPQM